MKGLHAFMCSFQERRQAQKEYSLIRLFPQGTLPMCLEVFFLDSRSRTRIKLTKMKFVEFWALFKRRANRDPQRFYSSGQKSKEIWYVLGHFVESRQNRHIVDTNPF